MLAQPSSAQEPVSDQANQLAALLQQSTLLRSYESLIQQFEEECSRKGKLVEQLERDF